MNKKLLALAPLCALMVSCATPTPYQPLDSNGGYSQMALNQNTYTVTFAGNTHTPRERVENYLLRRSAEVTLDNGYRYFERIGGRVRNDVGTYTIPATVTKSKDKDRKETTEVITPATTYTTNSYTAKMRIKMLRDNKLVPDAYDADLILKNFG